LGFPTGWSSTKLLHQHRTINKFFGTVARNKEEEAPTSTTRQQLFWRRCQGERGFLQGESLTSNLLFCYCFALFSFCLHLFIKKYKKTVPL
jgi:hypothetical protein